MFERLKALPTSQTEIREIYYLCLGLGFRGEYFVGLEDELQLTQIRHEQAQHLPLPVEDVQAIDKITRQPYEISPCKGQPIPWPLSAILLRVALALLIVVPLVLFVMYKLLPGTHVPQFQLMVTKAGGGSGTVSSTPLGINCGLDCSSTSASYARGTAVVLKAVPNPGSIFQGWTGAPDCAGRRMTMTADTTCTATFIPEPARPEIPLLTPELIRKPLSDSFPCAKISVDAVNQQSGVVTLGGRVASTEQQAEVRAVVQRDNRVTQVIDTFQIISRPFCDVLELLEPFQEQNDKQNLGLAASLDKKGNHPIYFKNEKLVIAVNTPAKFDSYVYVDYYTTGAEVGHMFPDLEMFPDAWKKLFRPATMLMIDGGSRPWRIRSPFGVELVTVIASKTPLFPTPRQAGEPAEAYIKSLRQALPKDPSSGEVAATFSFITTQDR